jgi:hypothetical protein
MRVTSINSQQVHISTVLEQLETLAKIQGLTIKELVAEAEATREKEPYQIRTQVLVRRLKHLGVRLEE